MNKYIRSIKRKVAISLLKHSGVISQIERLEEIIKKNSPYEILLPRIAPHKQTFDLLIKNKASLCRFGDGEWEIIFGGSIKFQEYDPLLSERLGNILRSNDENILVAIPDTFGSLAKYSDYARDYWRRYWARKREAVYSLLSFDKEYHDACISRPNNEFINKSNTLIESEFNSLRQVWDAKECILIYGGEEHEGKFNIFNNVASLTKIKTADKNAFALKEEIYNKVISCSKDVLVLLSLGPTATVLAYDLAKKGYQAIDIGHVNKDYNLFMEGCREGGKW